MKIVTRCFVCYMCMYGMYMLMLGSASSCNNSSSQKVHFKASLPVADTNAPAATYEKIKNQSPGTIDSVYSKLLSSLSDSDKYGLFQGHLACYAKLTGDRPFAHAFINESKGFLYLHFAKFDSAITCFDTAIYIYKKIENLPDLAETYSGRSTTYLVKQEYDKGVDGNYKALAIYEHLGDSAHIYHVKADIALAFANNDNFKAAISIITSCLGYYQRCKDTLSIAYCESILGVVYLSKLDYKEALPHNSVALVLRKKARDMEGVATSLNNTAISYMGLGQWDNAIGLFYQALQLDYSIDRMVNVPALKTNIINCLIKKGDLDVAEKLTKEVMDTALQMNQHMVQAMTYKYLSDIYDKEKKYEPAYLYYKKYKETYDSVYNSEKTKIINDLNIKYETGKKTAEIARLNAETKAGKFKQALYVTLLFATFIIAVLTVLFLVNRNKKNQLSMERVRLELEMNRKELQLFTDNIIGKNKLIEELEYKIQQSKQGEQIITGQEENSEQLSELYQLKILTEDDWSKYKMLFDKVHPGLISRLRLQYPELAPAEERQFLLIKLKIDTKESADILGISTASVRKNRYRLKKRFNLPEKEDLDAFVMNLI